MRLTARERRDLRRIGHHLQPIVTVGDAGVSEGVIAETDRALTDHELIKVRLPAGDKSDRQALTQSLCEACKAQAVQHIGRIALIYRKAERPDPAKSNILRDQLGRG